MGHLKTKSADMLPAVEYEPGQTRIVLDWARHPSAIAALKAVDRAVADTLDVVRPPAVLWLPVALPTAPAKPSKATRRAGDPVTRSQARTLKEQRKNKGRKPNGKRPRSRAK